MTKEVTFKVTYAILIPDEYVTELSNGELEDLICGRLADAVLIGGPDIIDID